MKAAKAGKNGTRTGGASPGKVPGRKRAAGAEQPGKREAILAAALDEFSARGFAATRLDDVAKRAGVAKGTIYLHFSDKEALLEELVRSMLGPIVGALEQAPRLDVPVRARLEAVIDLFVREFYGTRRRDVAWLIISE